MNNKLTKGKIKRTTDLVASSSVEVIITHNSESAEQKKGKYLQQLNKIKRNTGQDYYTKKGKFVPAKKFQSKNCNCTKKCIERINERQRLEIFDKFWSIGDFNEQNLFLCCNVQRKDINRRRPRNNMSTMRAYAYKFYLVTSDGNISVCKKFFLDTFQISSGRIDRLLKGERKFPEDMRGKMGGSRRKTSELKRNIVIEHLKSFPEFQNHNSLFHDPKLVIRKMYKSYLENCREDNRSSVSEWTYRKIFKEYFNVHFPINDSDNNGSVIDIKIEEITDDAEDTILEQEQCPLTKC